MSAVHRHSSTPTCHSDITRLTRHINTHKSEPTHVRPTHDTVTRNKSPHATTQFRKHAAHQRGTPLPSLRHLRALGRANELGGDAREELGRRLLLSEPFRLCRITLRVGAGDEALLELRLGEILGSR